MEAFLVLIKLLCAHLCADFIFQTDSINEGKRKPGIKGIIYQLLHSMVHAGVAYAFVADWTNTPASQIALERLQASGVQVLKHAFDVERPLMIL